MDEYNKRCLNLHVKLVVFFFSRVYNKTLTQWHEYLAEQQISRSRIKSEKHAYNKRYNSKHKALQKLAQIRDHQHQNLVNYELKR